MVAVPFVFPVMFAVITLVQVKIAPATSEVGVKFSCAPLQIVSVSGRLVNTGVGFTVTVVAVTDEAHPLPVAVNVYVTTCGVLLVVVKFSVMVPDAPNTVSPL